MGKLLYVYQNYRKSYSSASLSILRGLKKISEITTDEFEVKPISNLKNVNRVLNRLTYIRSFHFRRQNRLLEKTIKNGNYEYLFVMKGTDLKFQTLNRIKRNYPSVKLICFNPDDPFNEASSNSDIISSIPLYDVYCIWTRHLNEKLKSAGAKRIGYFPFGIDEEIIFPVEASHKYDISFIGNGDEERHQLISDLAKELEERNLNIQLHVFGNNWPSFGENVVVHGQRNGQALLETIAATKINLNLLRKQNKNSINMRTFEIPAAKGFMIHEESQEAKSFFSPEDEVIYFESIKDLVDKCEHYLSNENDRKRKIQNCSQKIEDGSFSYQKILESNLSLINN